MDGDKSQSLCYNIASEQRSDVIRSPIGKEALLMELITQTLVRSLLPKRDPNGHKGTFGKVYAYGGCAGLTGAPVYAGEAAARTGSGLVFVGVPKDVYPIIAARCAVSMAHPLPDSYPALLERIQSCDAALIGPGAGRAAETEETILSLLRDLPGPVVLDADGINAAAAHMNVLEGRRDQRRVTALTPHEGEFARLGGGLVPGAASPGQRERAAAAFARQYGCVLVLKGPNTVVAAPDGRTLVNSTGNCGMAKGGSGDMLAGMLLSLIGQGASALDAAVCAVWLHGRAGDLCAQELTGYAMTPPDMIQRLPAVFKELEC